MRHYKIKESNDGHEAGNKLNIQTDGEQFTVLM